MALKDNPTSSCHDNGFASQILEICEHLRLVRTSDDNHHYRRNDCYNERKNAEGLQNPNPKGYCRNVHCQLLSKYPTID